MNDGYIVTKKSFLKIAIFVMAVYIIELLKYCENNYNLGIWSLLHGDINVLFPRVFSLMSVVIIIVFVLVSLIFDNLAVLREIKWAGAAVDVLFCAIILITVGVTIEMYAGIYSNQKDIAKARGKLIQDKAVVHAGGFLEDSQGIVYDYTNSYDALLNAYENGNRVVEIDLFRIADGVVCAHGSSDEIGKYGFDLEDETLSMEQFLNAKIYGAFTPMSIDMLATFMREHEDLVIVTDVKGYNIDVCEILADSYPDLKDRFFVQMYHVSEFQPIWDMGFHHIIYTLYCATDEEKNPYSLNEACKLYDIMALTYWKGWMNGDKYASVIQDNIPKCEHTVNDVETMKEDLANGIDVFYTDNVDNDWMRK